MFVSYFTPSVKDQAEAVCIADCNHRGLTQQVDCGVIFVPFDLRIRRILLPRKTVSITATVRYRMDSVICTSNNLDLCDTMRISENDADLRRSSTLLCKLADLVDDLLGSGLQPRGRCSRVGDCGGRYALSVAVKTTHGCGCWIELRCRKFARIK